MSKKDFENVDSLMDDYFLSEPKPKKSIVKEEKASKPKKIQIKREKPTIIEEVEEKYDVPKLLKLSESQMRFINEQSLLQSTADDRVTSTEYIRRLINKEMDL